MSYSSKQGGGSRNSDEDGRIAVAVKVGMRPWITLGLAGEAVLILCSCSCANPSTAATE